MDKLDRLVWTAGLSFVSHGCRVGIRTNDGALLDRVGRVLPPGAVPSPSPIVTDLYSLVAGSNDPDARVRRFNVLYAGSAQASRTLDLDETLRALQSCLHRGIALHSPRRLFVHGCVVGWKGRALVLVGDEAMRVETTIGLLSAGAAAYYSNMYAVFDRRGRVHAYPTPLASGSPLFEGSEAAQAPLRPLAGRTRRKPLPVGLIAVLGGGPRPAVSDLSPAQAALALLGHTSVSRLRPQFALETLRTTVAGAVALDLRGQTSEDVSGQLIDRLSR